MVYCDRIWFLMFPHSLVPQLRLPITPPPCLLCTIHPTTSVGQESLTESYEAMLLYIHVESLLNYTESC